MPCQLAHCGGHLPAIKDNFNQTCVSLFSCKVTVCLVVTPQRQLLKMWGLFSLKKKKAFVFEPSVCFGLYWGD